MTITVIDTFSGSGDVGDEATFTPDVPLAGGDIYLVAWAMSGTTGGVSISPYDYSFYGSSAGADRSAVDTFKVGYTNDGATSYTVTVAGGPTAYYGWVLRGAATPYADPAIVTAYDIAQVSYTAASVPNPNPCLNEVTRTDWYGAAVLAAPAAGSFGVYAATVREGPCESGAPAPQVDGAGTSVATGTVGGIVQYDFGTVAGGSGTATIDATSGEHGTWAALTMFAIAPLESTPPPDPEPATIRPSLVVHDNIFVGNTSAAVLLDSVIRPVVNDNYMIDCGGTSAIALANVYGAKVTENRVTVSADGTPPTYAVELDGSCITCAVVNNDFRLGFGTAKLGDAGTSTTNLRNLPDADDPVNPHTHTALDITDFGEATESYVAALLVEGAGIDLTYDDGANTLTIAATGSGGLPIVTKTDSYTATLADCTIVCNKASAMTITLPAAATAYAGGSGHHYMIKNVGAGVVTVDGNASETIDGATTIALAQWDAVTIQTDGTGWVIL